MNNYIKKILLIVIFISYISYFAFAENLYDNENNEENIIIYDLSGLVFELSGFNFFSIGFGYNWGNLTVFNNHFSAATYGFLLKYKTKNEMQFRLYYNLYGGSAGMLLGASTVMTTNFDELTVGIAPHIGIGLGPMNIFYRYNFHLNNKFNIHEIVLKFYRWNRN